MAYIQERVREVARVKVEGGQQLALDNIKPFYMLYEHPISLQNLIVAPDGCDWKPRGRAGKLILFLGAKPMYEAPVEFLMAEWQRYQVGAVQFFRPVVLRVRQGVSLRLEETSLPVVVDLPVEYQRDVT
jgi:hypothetical protein